MPKLCQTINLFKSSKLNPRELVLTSISDNSNYSEGIKHAFFENLIFTKCLIRIDL